MVNKFDELLEQFGSNTETLNDTVLIDKEYLEEVKRKARFFDTFIKYKQHINAYGNQGGNELEKVFKDVMKEYEEDS